MPNRILRDWTDSGTVNALSDAAEKFFVRLIMKADDFGRYHGAEQMLRPMLFPLQLEKVREADIQRWIAECEKAGLVRLYVSENKKVLEINKFRQSVRAARSKFPAICEADAKQVRSKCDAHAPVFGVGDVFGDVCGVGDSQPLELPSEAQAVEMTMTAGIPEGFVRYIYQDWFTRGGKDAGRCDVKFLPYVSKRWQRERNEWLSKTHNGNKTSSKKSGKLFAP